MGAQSRHQRRPTPGLDRAARFGNALWHGAEPDARERGRVVKPRRRWGQADGRMPLALRADFNFLILQIHQPTRQAVAMAAMTYLQWLCTMPPMKPTIPVPDRKSTRLNSSHLGIS